MRSMRWALSGVDFVLVSCGGGPSSTTIEVGDTGPGGGIIVYVDVAGFDNSSGDDTSMGAMCLTGTCHYLEMAPEDWRGTFSWSDAISAAENYSTSTADDWVLPSKDALNVMCKYAFRDKVNAICNDSGKGDFTRSVGGFSPGFYWSSSEYDGNHAWFQYFINGDWGWLGEKGNNKTQYYVRPVRAF